MKLKKTENRCAFERFWLIWGGKSHGIPMERQICRSRGKEGGASSKSPNTESRRSSVGNHAPLGGEVYPGRERKSEIQGRRWGAF